MTNPFDAYTPQPTGTGLEALISMAERARDLEQQKADLESAIKAINAELQEINERSLPEMFAELGLSEFKLDDGTKIKVSDFVRGTINRAPDRETALQWLVDHGGEGLIKNEVGMSFDRNEHNRALDIAQSLREKGFEVDVKSDVHPQSLAAFVREKLANGEEVDTERLGVYCGRQAKFSLGKGK